MITIHGLLEGRNDYYVTSRLMRAFHSELLKENLISIFRAYVSYYGINYYDKDVFNHTSENEEYANYGLQPQDQNPNYYALVIEVGMMIYHLMRMFQEVDDDDGEVHETDLPPVEEENDLDLFFGGKLLGGLGKIGMAFVKNSLATMTKLAKSIDIDGKEVEEDTAEILEAAYKFFETNTCHIEIIFNEEIIKYYFAKPPIAVGLTEEIKDDFSNKADRTSTQTKLRFLTVKSEKIIEQLHYEHLLQKFFNKNQCISIFASSVGLYREMAFMITIILNFFIISSYSEYKTDSDETDRWTDRIWRYSLFFYDSYDNTQGGLSYTKTKNIMIILGVSQVVCSALIVSFFLMKKGPVLAKEA